MKFVTGLLAAVLLLAGGRARHAGGGVAGGRRGPRRAPRGTYQRPRPAGETNSEATQMLYSMYPAPIKRWIAARGGLTPKMIFLRGKALQAMYKPCYLDAQASANRPATASQR